MAAMSTMMLGRLIFRPTIHSQISVPLFRATLPVTSFSGPDRPATIAQVRCAATKSGGDEKKSPARLAEVQRLLYQAEERYKAGGGGVEPIPKITLDHVTIGYARSGGPGGQNVNKVNTKVDMRFNVKNAHWLSERVRERIMQMIPLLMALPFIIPYPCSGKQVTCAAGPFFNLAEAAALPDTCEKNWINKDGEIVISSTKTRTQKSNVEDALAKLQAIIDAASYVPPPPSEETVKKIAKLSAIGEQKRLDKKKAQSQKKSQRRSRDGWD
ncbi:hypothetical protein DH2020_027583 [Rehmannia glutinosa]|uniref:Prokaryotic-type class I peptide chain release factors domain-containing protein n=1 Tax=Rehmannia glutinosa TaxID=99300 RepID=A0ABR0VTS1_REHGL